ncbi:glycerate kinase [Conexibacter sp. DBS9H8]|uniref:glycerate kinase family protein n=1 Tax=Conexibacter sp. DBS9H8 TaxID=2937801 RepID=UPI00200FB383|nr:glycerate kinase [Conexibacter sp. DBS9H8]
MARRGIPTDVLVAPDSFKGTLSATQVAAAIGAGLSAAGRPVSLCPVADGGEGTLAAVGGPLGLDPVEVTVSDPLGRPVRALYGLGDGVALIEMAAASGLGLVGPEERDAVAASSAGTGELILAACAAGAQTVCVAAGGSATTDGGAGALEVIAAAGGIGTVRVVVLCDVGTVFERAAAVYGPQKGASAEQVAALTTRLDRLAGAWPRDPRGVAMTGAAGGLAGGLWAQLGAELRGGARFVLETVGFDVRMRAARAVVVGEGRLDRQSLAGKVCGEIATRARQAGVPCHAIVGRCLLDRFDQRILDLQVILEAGTIEALEAAGRELAARL